MRGGNQRILTKDEYETFDRWIKRKEYGALRAFFETVPYDALIMGITQRGILLVNYVCSVFVDDPAVFEMVVDKALAAGHTFRLDFMFETHMTQHLEVLMNAGVPIDPRKITRMEPCGCFPSECLCVQFKEHYMRRQSTLRAIVWCFANTQPAFMDVLFECFGDTFNKTSLASWNTKKRRPQKKIKR